MTPGYIILAASDPVQHVLPHKLFEIGSFAITNLMVMQAFVAAVMVVVFVWLGRDYPLVPRGTRLFFETTLQVVREGMARPVLKDRTDTYIPFVWTVFFFVLFNNLIGLLPMNAIIGAAARRPSEIFGTATASLSVTAAMATIVFVVTVVSAIIEEIRHQLHHGRPLPVAAVMGIILYFYHLVPPVPGIVGVILFPLLFVLELIGVFVKPFALAMRLFANILGGHILLSVLLMLIPVINGFSSGGMAVGMIVGCTAMNALELFVAFLQAYIFTFLSCLYIGMAINPEH
jgi:F-type H+-transporting ATPase subunit a